MVKVVLSLVISILTFFGQTDANNYSRFLIKPMIYKYSNFSAFYNSYLTWSNINQFDNYRQEFSRGFYIINLNLGIDRIESGKIKLEQCYHSQRNIYSIDFSKKITSMSVISLNTIEQFSGLSKICVFISNMTIYGEILSKSTSLSVIKFNANSYLFAKLSSPSGSMLYMEIRKSLNIGGWRNKIKIVEDGIYFLTLFVEHDWREDFHLTINSSANHQFLFYKRSFESSNNVYSMSYLFKAKKRDIFYLNRLQGGLDQKGYNKLSLVKLEPSMNKPVLYVTSSISKQNLKLRQQVKFNVKQIAIGNKWNELDYSYKIRIQGIYYIYTTVESQEGASLEISVEKNTETLFEILKYGDLTYDGDILANSGIFRLSENDVIRVYSRENTSYRSTSNSTSLMIYFLSI